MAWTEEDKTTLQRLWLSGRGSGEIARHLGTVSRNAVMGMVNRLGLMGRQGTAGPPPMDDHPRPANDDPALPLDPPAPLIDIPANDEPAAMPEPPPAAATIRPSDARTLLEEAFGAPYDPRTGGHLSGLVAIAAIIAGRDAKSVAAATGLRMRTATAALGLLDDAGVWREGETAPRYWLDARSGTVAFVMDMLVTEGVIDRIYDEDAAAWRYVTAAGRLETAA